VGRLRVRSEGVGVVWAEAEGSGVAVSSGVAAVR
jgi:hypothetical protein